MESGLDHSADPRHECQDPVATVVFLESEMDRLRATLPLQLGEVPCVLLLEDAGDARREARLVTLFQLARIAPVKLFGEDPQVRENFSLVRLRDPIDIGLGEL